MRISRLMGALVVAMAGVAVVSTPAAAVPQAMGTGVRVAVIDSGIDIAHPCFADAGVPEQPRAGELAFTSDRVPIARSFSDGGAHAIYPDGPIIGEDPTAAAVQPHGTQVAGIVACAGDTVATIGGRTVDLSGFAPQASLASYVVFPGQGLEGVGPSDAIIAAAIDRAVADGAQVVNLSLSLPSSDATDAAITRAWAADVVVVVAAGNDGPGAGTIARPADHPDAIAVGSVESGWIYEATLRVDGSDYFGHVADGIEVGSAVRGPTAPIREADTTGSAAQKVPNPLDLGLGCEAGAYAGASGRIALVARGGCTFSQKVASAASAGVLGVVIVTPDGADITPLYTGGSTVPAMVVHPDAGRAVIDHPWIELLPAALQQTGRTGSLSDFSARGPSRHGAVKPDVLATGGGVLTASVPGFCLDADPCMAMASGTSLAAPAVSGVVALVRAAHPAWSAAMVRSAVVHTAAAIRGVPLMAQGAGIADAAAAMAAPLGVDALSLSLAPGRLGSLVVLNPSDEPQRANVAVEATPDGAPVPSLEVPGAVDVPAGGSAGMTLRATPSSAAGQALVVLTVGSRSIRVPVTVGP